MQVRIQVNANAAAIQTAIADVKSAFEKEGISVQAIQVLTPVDFVAAVAESAPVQEEHAAALPQIQPSLTEKLEDKLKKLYGTKEPLYIPFNVTSSKRVEGKLLNEYTISELLNLGQIGVVETVRKKLIDLITSGQVDEVNPFPVRLYWTEKALIADKKLDVFTESLLIQ